MLYAGKRRREIGKRVSEVLEQVGLARYEDQFPKNMSGGQQQRVSIARAISTNPKFLIADEPTGALDTETSQEIMNLFKVADNVGLPLLYAGKRRREIGERVSEVLEQVGLAGYESQFPKNMSGGQQQRVSIARAISTNPKFLIADEPTGALDTETSQEIMNLFKRLNHEEGTTSIMVTHDPHVAKQCDRIIKIIDGRIVSDSKGGEYHADN